MTTKAESLFPRLLRPKASLSSGSGRSMDVERKKHFGRIQLDKSWCHHEGKSVFDVLLQRNPGAAEEILNEGIMTNFQVSDLP